MCLFFIGRSSIFLSRGGTTSTCSPQRDPILSFSHTFLLKSAVSEVGTPQMGQWPPSNRKLWINHCPGIATHMYPNPPTSPPPQKGTLTSVPNNRIQWQFQDFPLGGHQLMGGYQHPTQTIFGGHYMKMIKLGPGEWGGASSAPWIRQ